MKDLKQLIADFEKDLVERLKNGVALEYPEIVEMHTTSLKSLLLALQEEAEKERRELPPYNYLPQSEAEAIIIAIKVGKNEMIDKFSTLITEAIENLTKE